MKIILTAACMLFATVAMQSNAFAACNLTACAVAINGDAGTTSRLCTSPGTPCSCAQAYTGCTQNKSILLADPCGSGWFTQSNNLNGTHKCCSKTSSCFKNLEEGAIEDDEIEAIDEEIISTSEHDFDDIYGQDMVTPLEEPHFGWVNGVNRSPTLGRANSHQAKLDACLFFTDVDDIATQTQCNTACGDAANKNEYCNANTNAVCLDRCECWLQFGTCNNL